MASWDSPDLLRRCQRLARRPATDADMALEDWYDLLTQAEAHWVPQFAAHVPEVLYRGEQMTSSDGGVTWEVSTWPFGRMEIYDRPGGSLLRIGAPWDTEADGTWEGRGFRVPGNRARTFPDGGPHARYVRGPGVIDAATESAIQPPHARMLLVYHAVAEWASQGGLRDPAPYLAMAQATWGGDPDRPGDTGILGALKMSLYGVGQAASMAATGAWWRTPDLGG